MDRSDLLRQMLSEVAGLVSSLEKMKPEDLKGPMKEDIARKLDQLDDVVAWFKAVHEQALKQEGISETDIEILKHQDLNTMTPKTKALIEMSTRLQKDVQMVKRNLEKEISRRRKQEAPSRQEEQKKGRRRKKKFKRLGEDKKWKPL